MGTSPPSIVRSQIATMPLEPPAASRNGEWEKKETEKTCPIAIDLLETRTGTEAPELLLLLLLLPLLLACESQILTLVSRLQVAMSPLASDDCAMPVVFCACALMLHSALSGILQSYSSKVPSSQLAKRPAELWIFHCMASDGEGRAYLATVAVGPARASKTHSVLSSDDVARIVSSVGFQATHCTRPTCSSEKVWRRRPPPSKSHSLTVLSALPEASR